MSLSTSSQKKMFNSTAKAEHVQRKFVLHDSGTISSSGAGTISSAAISFNPSSAQDWGKLSSYYDEFRVLGVRVQLLPNQIFSVTKLNDIIAMYHDNDSATPDSFAVALQRSNKVMIPAIFTTTDSLPSFTFMRPNTKDSPIPWDDVATPSSSGGAIVFVSQVATLSTSTNYLTWYVEYLVEARGAR